MPNSRDLEVQSIVQIGMVDSARVVGSFLWNFFLRGPILASSIFTRLQLSARGDALGVRLAEKLKARYGSPFLESWYPFRKTVLILDGDVAADFLAAAEAPDGPVRQAAINGSVFNRFMANALFVSDDEARVRKRAYNECALDTPPTEPTQHDAGVRIHEFEQAFVDIVAEEVSLMMRTKDGSMRWRQLANMAKSATFRIVLGSDASRQEMQALMAKLEGAIYWASYTMGLLGRGPARRFRSDLERYLAGTGAAAIGNHARRCQGADDPASETTMWLFALKDALDTHVPRTLFLILSQPRIYDRVLSEIEGKDLRDPGNIRNLALLRGCVHEAVRLWTPVQHIVKLTGERGVTLKDLRLPPNRQVAIHAAYINRSTASMSRPDQFDPDRWRDGAGPKLLHFSRGPRRCAGSHIAQFVMTAVLANILARRNLQLVAPRVTLPDGRIPQLINHFALDISVGA